MHQNLAEVMTNLDLPVDLLPAQYAGTPVVVNGRLSRALGRARWRRSPFGSTTPYVASIELQPWVLDGDLQIAREIVAHEAAHVVCGPDVGHGFPWGQWCRKLGGTGERTIRIERVAAFIVEKPMPVVALCARCRVEIRRRRALKLGARFTHTGCGGEIIPVDWR